ncbi:cation acetate symporter [Herbaspirillum lusitanum]|uniref:Cation acetate symporter n=1 Tax=Herbaspirillum lusitanum TaxID=213312 RepID=A0ABW9A7U3_9BURK
MKRSTAIRAGVALALIGAANGAMAQSKVLVGDDYRGMTIAVFAVLFGATMFITYLASKRNRTATDFYTAGGGIGPIRNGLAIAGDYLSAAAFLGVSGLIALYGYDGIAYLIGFFIAFIPVLLLVAEPCRNLGRYTLGDVLAYRNSFRSTKVAAALSSIIVAVFYMVPQIVGGAVIIRALIGIPYEISVLAVGLLMLTYVMFGGMRATTSVQVIKAVLLISSCFVLVVLAWLPFGFNVPGFFNSLTNDQRLQSYVAEALLKGATTLNLQEAGQRFLEPGLYLKNPLEQVSLGLALVLGTAAMPHILMRFFTVPDAKAARSSVLWAMLAIGACHLLIIFIGFAAAHYVGAKAIVVLDKGGNLAAPMLAQFLGGGVDSLAGNFMLAFVAAVSFATIVAVVAGLTLAAASALAHDVYVGAIRNGQATEQEQVKAARVATLLMALVCVVCGILAKGQNVAHLVGLGYAVAASANLPALLLTLYWKRCNTAGVLAGVIGGTLLAIGLVLVSPNMTYPQQQKSAATASAAALTERLLQAEKTPATVSPGELAKLRADKDAAVATAAAIPADATSIVGLAAPLISLRNPGVISIPVGFLLVILGSLLFSDRRASQRWEELAVRRETGIGIDQAVSH